jgi:hypothetical protein
MPEELTLHNHRFEKRILHSVPLGGGYSSQRVGFQRTKITPHYGSQLTLIGFNVCELNAYL